jgi:hypothetical protein
MLNEKFKHHAWFKDKNMIVKEFLDYVLSNGDFHIKTKTQCNDNLLEQPKIEYYLSDNRYSMKLGYQERNYLAEHSGYFKTRLPQVNPNYMMAIIAVNGEPIADTHDIVYFSR